MDNKFHFGLKIVVIGQTTILMKKFIESIPGVEVDSSETFRFLKVYTFPLYVSDSLILRIDLWALPEDVKQRGDAQLLCCDASIVFYISDNENDLLSILSIYHKEIRTANAQCKYIVCGDLSEDSLSSLGKASGFTINHIEKMEPSEIAFVFKSSIASLISEIPNPPDPVFMLHKNIKLGSLLLDDPSYRRALRPTFPQ